MANKTFDELGLIVEDETVTATASVAGVEIEGLNIGSASYLAVVNAGATTGTVDGSNYYTVKLEVSDLVGGTYYQVGNQVPSIAEANGYQIGFTSEQIEAIVAGAKFFRITAEQVGTSATEVTYTAFLSRI